MIDIIIKPRQSGKSGSIIKFCENEPDSVIYSFTHQNVKRILRKIPNSYHYKDSTVGLSRYKHIYYDDCFYMSNLPMNFLHNLTLKGYKVTMIGTPAFNLDDNMLRYFKEYYPEELI